MGEDTASKKAKISVEADNTELELDYLGNTIPAAGRDIDMMSPAPNQNPAPQEQPPWLIGFEDRVAKKTANLMEARISGIETHAQQTRADMAAMQQQLNRQSSAQIELKAQVTGMQEAFMVAQKKSEEECRDDRSRTTADTGDHRGGNPYSKPVIDKSIIVIGGWPENTAAPMMIANAKDMLKSFNRDAGNTWSFEETRCLGQRGDNLQCKLKSTADRTSTQQGYDLCKWMRAQNPKPQAVGFREEANAMWSVMNQPIESRNLSKAINRAIRCLHLLREKAGIPETTMEQGYPLKVIESMYKGRTLGALVCGTFVAVISESTLTTTWDYPKLKDSIIAATEADVNQMLSTIIPTHGD